MRVIRYAAQCPAEHSTQHVQAADLQTKSRVFRVLFPDRPSSTRSSSPASPCSSLSRGPHGGVRASGSDFMVLVGMWRCMGVHEGKIQWERGHVGGTQQGYI